MTEDEAVAAMAVIVTARADLTVRLGAAHDARIWEPLGLGSWEDFLAAVDGTEAPAPRKAPARARKAHRTQEDADRDPRPAKARATGRQVTPRFK
jgi:hypothetical protein